MNEQQQRDHQRVARAIRFLQANYREQPSLERIATEVRMSPYHFQRLFTARAGVSPKKFVQHLSLVHAKRLLRERGTAVLDTALDTGLSGPSRLHDLFVGIEAMTPGEFKEGGAALRFRFRRAETLLGPVLLVSTARGLARLVFLAGEPDALEAMRREFPRARFEEGDDAFQKSALSFFGESGAEAGPLALHLKGTPFQLQVWRALLRVPTGGLTSYGDLAEAVGRPAAARAVGTAVGRNPVACLIPCHRVIRAGGEPGEYRWGADLKRTLLAWEAARADGGE